jgi:hypothetical protein
MPTVKRTCKNCEVEKTTIDFRRGQYICNVCEADPNFSCQKSCNECGETKDSKLFRKNRGKCIDCERAHGRNYRRTTTKAQEWVDNNKERMVELQHNWYEENKTQIRKNERDRKANDPVFKKIKNHRCLLNKMVRGGAKYSKQIESDKDDLWAWFKYCNADLNIDTYNTIWNIDHILPLDLILNEDNHTKIVNILKKEGVIDTIYCWYNMMPLKIKDNRNKSNVISQERLISHLKNINTFLKKNKHINEQMKDNENFFKYKKAVQNIIDTCY